jgi:hypothetical protein
MIMIIYLTVIYYFNESVFRIVSSEETVMYVVACYIGHMCS